MLIDITQIDTACMLIDINGFRILTDPTFDDAGGTYQSGGGRTLHKLGAPAIGVGSIPGNPYPLPWTNSALFFPYCIY